MDWAITVLKALAPAISSIRGFVLIAIGIYKYQDSDK